MQEFLSDTEKTIRIMTYNIHGGRGTDGVIDYARIGHMMNEENIDIALLQEVDTRPYRVKKESRIKVSQNRNFDYLIGKHFPYYIWAPTIHTKEGWYGNAVLSRFPFLDSLRVDISFKGREPRNFIDTYIETPQGLLRVINTHKGLQRAERAHQTKKICTELDENPQIPLIFGGDVNEWQALFSVLKILTRHLRPHNAGASWPSFFPIFSLDRFWSRPEGLIKSAKVLKKPEMRKFSDHLPVISEVVL